MLFAHVLIYSLVRPRSLTIATAAGMNATMHQQFALPTRQFTMLVHYHRPEARFAIHYKSLFSERPRWQVGKQWLVDVHRNRLGYSPVFVRIKSATAMTVVQIVTILGEPVRWRTRCHQLRDGRKLGHVLFIYVNWTIERIPGTMIVLSADDDNYIVTFMPARWYWSCSDVLSMGYRVDSGGFRIYSGYGMHHRKKCRSYIISLSSGHRLKDGENWVNWRDNLSKWDIKRSRCWIKKAKLRKPTDQPSLHLIATIVWTVRT